MMRNEEEINEYHTSLNKRSRRAFEVYTEPKSRSQRNLGTWHTKRVNSAHVTAQIGSTTESGVAEDAGRLVAMHFEVLGQRSEGKEVLDSTGQGPVKDEWRGWRVVKGHDGDTLTQAIHCEGIVSRLPRARNFGLENARILTLCPDWRFLTQADHFFANRGDIKDVRGQREHSRSNDDCNFAGSACRGA
ncbi:hypothetical protein EAI_14712 [Harpegnathos saltator]|uniref:Uncharacterized protein n=1 Tax=Harpegnathos saltator TaxID=610380 RepID=E2BV74_HARSA|nr:hypothetical protein EAI_14712 [Harpegnathos saltator]